MIGTSASAGCKPLQKSANHDRLPAPIRYGQKLRTRRRRSPTATTIAAATISMPEAS